MYAISVTGVAGKRPERAFFSVFWREAEYGVKRVRRLVFKALECLRCSGFRWLRGRKSMENPPSAARRIAAVQRQYKGNEILKNRFLFLLPAGSFLSADLPGYPL